MLLMALMWLCYLFGRERVEQITPAELCSTCTVGVVHTFLPNLHVTWPTSLLSAGQATTQST